MHGVFLRFLIVVLPVWAAACSGSESPGGSPLGAAPEIRQWGRFETRLDVPVGAGNPYDPAEVSVDVTFRAPGGGDVTVPAFVLQPFERELAGGIERLTPAGEPEWRVRFTPTQTGTWSWRWTETNAGGARSSGWSSFEVVEPAPGKHGFLRVSDRDSRYLAFDDGTPFFAVGENLCWYDKRGTFAYDDWLGKLAAQGANYVRLWMPSWAFALEWIQRDGAGRVAHSSLGDYAARMDRAWQLDRVLDRAEELGIHVMLCIQNHGPFSLTHNPEWKDNPYNAENGGPIASPGEFFDDAGARLLFERRLRYIAARWGYAPHVLAWELWNEVDGTEQPPLPRLVEWHARMAGALGAFDPNRRLVTTSLTGTSVIVDTLLGTRLYGPLWALPEMDFVQLHFYLVGEIQVDFASLFPSLVRTLRAYGKPVLIGEAGVDYRGPAETLRADPEGHGFRDILWSGVFSGSPGVGMSWWWDNMVDPKGWYFHFGAVARFVEGVAFDREGFVSGGAVAEAGDERLETYALRGRSVVLAWVRNAAGPWFRPEPGEVEGAVLRLAGLEGASWKGWWYDTRSGEMLVEATLPAARGETRLDVPAFTRDIALRLERVL